MAYAILTEDKRIIVWSKEHLSDTECEFEDNGYIDSHHKGELLDFRIEDGNVIFDPSPERLEAIKHAEALRTLVQYEEENDIALCELYEMVIGGGM